MTCYRNNTCQLDLLIVYSLVSGESCQGAIVQNGTNQTIVDANNATWTIGNDTIIYKDGQKAGYSGNVILLVYWNGIVYQEANSGGWWKWINNNWADANDSQLIFSVTSPSGCTPIILSGNLGILFHFLFYEIEFRYLFFF
jgi:hypothetical protein